MKTSRKIKDIVCFAVLMPIVLLLLLLLLPFWGLSSLWHRKFVGFDSDENSEGILLVCELVILLVKGKN
jgi:hypothetical protein